VYCSRCLGVVPLWLCTGMHIILEMIDRARGQVKTGKEKASATKYFDPPKLASWLLDHSYIDLLIGKRSHTELLKRAGPILEITLQYYRPPPPSPPTSFAAAATSVATSAPHKKDKDSVKVMDVPYHLFAIWKALMWSRPHAVERPFFEELLLHVVTPRVSAAHLRLFWNSINDNLQEYLPVEIEREPKMLKAVFRFANIAKDVETKAKVAPEFSTAFGLKLFWTCFHHTSGLPKASMECAAECLKSLLQRPDMIHHRQEYMNMCVQAWKSGGMRDSGPYMKLLQYLLGTIPTTWSGSSTGVPKDSCLHFVFLGDISW
jgi:hypothetical protein